MNKEISASDAYKMFEQGDVILLDVRDADELEICKIDGAQHIPMTQIPQNLDHLPRDQRLVVFCHHGMRSQHVCLFLEGHGLDNAVSMTGGINAWTDEVDPSLQRY
ncbi:rhodanese-like domain-containing protein [Coraliomargarita akajimensis]|uniref:Rhodanese domain protein n=1 Tax=Coraliomargarita akajimensis (strain DSM 45221 / IAM 15411 / JCM 23193 / KCTC 12865 / 04OKA010-24) TaxID=583355 RepID=D5EKC8_CORAD|nr:rhodanese-like domain-containing protein [Coraliomargarita akajimensis]ADE54877.1 Rhodanese domain protein [Coraliomargarita akajimensis DSM 45221]